jgi:inosose dehydratase
MCEPGLGVVDFDAILAVLPDDYDGDFMIEIDEPSGDSRFEPHRVCYEWAVRNLPATDLPAPSS